MELIYIFIAVLIFFGQLENGFFKALLVSITWPISFIILAIVHVITVLKIVNNK
jgi:hypothetical protein